MSGWEDASNSRAAARSRTCGSPLDAALGLALGVGQALVQVTAPATAPVLAPLHTVND